MNNHQRGAFSLELAQPVEAGQRQVPDLVQLLPAAQFQGRDGRGPYQADIPAILKAFSSWGMELAIDYDHQGLNAEKNGAPAPAAGWIKRLVSDRGALWGKVEWTPKAREMLAAGEYRYLSPVFDHTPAGTVVRIIGAGLTNTPNLHLTAINNHSNCPGFNLEHGANPLVRDAMSRRKDGGYEARANRSVNPLIRDAEQRALKQRALK